MPNEFLDLQKHTLNLHRGDMEKLRQLFPKSEPTVIIRELVRSCIVHAEGEPAELPPMDVKLNLGGQK